MARLDCEVYFQDFALVAANWKTAASIKAPANQCVAIKRIKVCAEGIAGDAKPISYRLARITADSGTATTDTPRKVNNVMSATPQAVVRTNFTGEPTVSPSGEYLIPGKFHPQGGSVDELVFGEILIKEGTEIALQLGWDSGGTNVNVTGHILYEE